MATVCDGSDSITSNADPTDPIHVIDLVNNLDRLIAIREERNHLFNEMRGVEDAICRFCDIDPDLSDWTKKAVSFRIGDRVVKVSGSRMFPEVKVEILPSKVIQD